MKKYNFFNKIKNSILGNSDFYGDIIKESFSKAFSYIIVLILLISIVFGIIEGMIARNAIDNVLNEVEKPSFPTFLLQEGKLSITPDEPIVISNSNYFYVIIDTTGTYSLNDLAGYELAFLITDERVITSSSGMSPQLLLDFKDLKTITFNKSELINLLIFSKRFVFLFMIPFIVILTYITFIFKTLVASIFGVMAKNIMSIKITYTEIIKIVFYSFTLPLILSQIMVIVNIPTDYRLIIFFAISGMYILRGIRANTTLIE